MKEFPADTGLERKRWGSHWAGGPGQEGTNARALTQDSLPGQGPRRRGTCLRDGGLGTLV